MKILRLSPYFKPEQIASTHLTRDLDAAFQEVGIYTDVYCPTPTRGISDEVRREYKKIKYEELNDGFLKVHRFAMFREGRNPIQRALRYVLCNIVQYWKGIHAKDIDLIYAASTPPTQGILCGMVKKRLKVPFVYNLQDIFPDSLVTAKMAKKGGLLWKIGRKIEDKTYRYSDLIVVISEDFKKNIMEKGVPEDKIVIIRNWVDENAVQDIPREENELFDTYGIDRNKFYVCYSGNIGLSQNMDMLLDVAASLQENENIGFILVGEGAYKQQVEARIKAENIRNITMMPFQPYEKISQVFSLGDVGLIISKKGIGQSSVPSKTWSVMSASRPVLASFDKGSELDSIVTETNCGICVEANDPDAFRAAILQMAEDKEKLTQMGKNGRRYIEENLTREIGTSKWVDVMHRVVEEG